ncbi:ribosomal-processing cysteine protease Prp [Harryflintia acetispora]|uniref:Ribosomal processing cysteine protease Prp n=1 Tax=Harryflintia acetispora TaxID=1849041 RepID=A0A9X8UKC7_9FIRM|nr:ribosomal-processing cysteine protease Prp [Harryflintia acetispora]TCL43551.1 hypothetical protein EDD78_105185 [Harryflintia acetispora]
MIVARFFCREGRPRGFTVSGHAGYAEAGSDIVCAAATSAVQLVCNTITDVLCEEAQVTVEEDRVTLRLDGEECAAAQSLLEGLYLHLNILREQYPGHVKATKVENQ